jgi:hypothetical protein
MIQKPKKTEAELRAIIMQEIRKHPQFGSIQDVAIDRPIQKNPHDPNWGFAWIVDGPPLRPAGADEIVRHLQNQLDLI